MPESQTLESTVSPAMPGFDEIVTLVVKHRVKAGQDGAYEAWLRRIVSVAGQWPGHLGVDVVRGKQGGLSLFTCVLRFCSTEAMQRWLMATRPKSLPTRSSGSRRWPMPPRHRRAGSNRW
jgi:antibiotic biosynthesis monooxygenase (ABM) superfamily enzyme